MWYKPLACLSTETLKSFPHAVLASINVNLNFDDAKPFHELKMRLFIHVSPAASLSGNTRDQCRHGRSLPGEGVKSVQMVYLKNRNQYKCLSFTDV